MVRLSQGPSAMPAGIAVPFATVPVRRRVGEMEDRDGLRAEEREPLPDLRAGQGHQPPLPAEKDVVVGGWRLCQVAGGGTGEQRRYS
jgi:hypothetical protein